MAIKRRNYDRGAKTIQPSDHLHTVRNLALSLPAVEEGTSYGTPAFRIKGKLLARLLEDGVTLVLRMDYETRDFLMQFDPDVYYITDHYRNAPYVLVRLSAVDPKELLEHLERAWRSCAPKKLLDGYSPSWSFESES
ncbi:MmcQ/YjbR family DNA-binding protein [Paenibacillus lactis]|uniref:MmcQ/YjbR family DNA-binding protein n=2 Tax=Paenibacillus lactis TaxID=228574 RepID=G4HJ14_9BACL|nr:MmcQ/YjbR family DNA-binding protein [Paenibacillus lactis]EHB62732.1 hypothetical protein PaelaDRAFT_3975 [Paenibacillus lactis 154]MBP1895452.1 hypothetical protein [Paenibacillus lactis]